MRILIAAASFSRNLSGVSRHAANLARCLLLDPYVQAVDFVVAPWQRHLLEGAGLDLDVRLSVHIAEMSQGAFGRNLWYYRGLPELAAGLRSHIVHLSHPMPVNSRAFATPTVVSLHDLYPYEIPSNFGFPKFIVNRLVLQQCLHSVDAIACVSDFTHDLLKHYVGANVARKATRIYNCVEPWAKDRAAPQIEGWRNQPFLLCVAQHRRNKNIPLLIRAFARLRIKRLVGSTMKLLVVGIRGPETDAIQRLVSDLEIGSSVVFAEGLSEPELQWCYANCELLAVPSITEGFGLPVAEALLVGCRIVCADIPALREIGGEHCSFVNVRGRKKDALELAIVSALNTPKSHGVALPQLSAPELSQQYLTLYRRLLISAAIQQKAGGARPANRPASERPPL